MNLCERCALVPIIIHYHLQFIHVSSRKNIEARGFRLGSRRKALLMVDLMHFYICLIFATITDIFFLQRRA